MADSQDIDTLPSMVGLERDFIRIQHSIRLPSLLACVHGFRLDWWMARHSMHPAPANDLAVWRVTQTRTCRAWPGAKPCLFSTFC